MKSENYMFAKLMGFSADVDLLKKHFLEEVTKTDPILFKDNNVKYYGWAITSRDGSVDDGVKRISDNTNNIRGVTPTKVCSGYLLEVMDSLKDAGVSPYRARLMQMESEGDEMQFHVDATKETWRLHIPITTNPDCLFEWRREDGTIESVHLPADGSAWLVRVDVQHRAINKSKGSASRVHLLMGCADGLKTGMLSEPCIKI
ncbi:hypothetical protein GIR22_20750 [Pseudomonas sp. CCM 7891]|uniref:Aspartyl/asparaginy/proline hydroxylase domain-containing protein n=1 Tax=Pseudomonas karstica TaxID=1055468 RepID=A0A7X2RUX1_9PSED|nr:aspartyl/asparaginyl beta-hydroxylase domain-containing protein [Pseudomonas karstica]MTD21557.1 hypothetical protein [Pseudomonas karstica]